MQLIQNYGLFWRRELVPLHSKKPDIKSEEWPRSGILLGVGVRKKRQGVVDFSDQRGIYALYDDQFRLVYVGQAGSTRGRLYKRLRNHTKSILAERWSRFSWFGIVPVIENDSGLVISDDAAENNIQTSKSTALDHIEAVLIASGEPLRNKQGGRFGPNTTHYRQFKGGFDDKEDFDESELNEP